MKTALEILYKYSPDPTARAILNQAQNPVVRADKENRALQMELDFPRLVEKDELYRIEEQVAEAYGLNYVKYADNPVLDDKDLPTFTAEDEWPTMGQKQGIQPIYARF